MPSSDKAMEEFEKRADRILVKVLQVGGGQIPNKAVRQLEVSLPALREAAQAYADARVEEELGNLLSKKQEVVWYGDDYAEEGMGDWISPDVVSARLAALKQEADHGNE